MKKIISTSILIISLIRIALCQSNFDSEKLDKYFEVLEQHNKFMGSVAVSKNGEIIYSKTIGFANIENNLKANENSKYKIGSITKTFTSVLILKAVEDKKLNLNQTINTWFPSIENANKITIENLLNHRSGINDFTKTKDYFTWNTQTKTEKELIEIITKGGSNFIPNSKAEYSNSNFILLTFILEKIYRKSYSDLLLELIVKPIGLTNTYVFKKMNLSQNECSSYKFNEKWELESETHFSIPLGAGAIISTPKDLTKFADALFNGKLLSKESISLMKKMKDGYGFGLRTFPFYENEGIGHAGTIDGFNSTLSHFANEKISFAIVSNGTSININLISIAVLSVIYNKPFDIPSFSTYKITSEDLEKYLGTYTSNQIPLKITITKDAYNLIAQATGQSPFPLEATQKDIFKFDQAGIILEFNTTLKSMILKQGGGEFNFMKE